MATLKARLRLTGTVSTDAQSIIDLALEEVRVGLFNDNGGLGEATVVEILAVAFVENALTNAELRRTRANALEIKWVRMLLLRRMPTLFMDGSGVTLEMWNQEPLTRKGTSAIEKEISALESEIQDEIAGLLGTTEEGILDSLTFEPATAVEKPLSSLEPWYF